MNVVVSISGVSAVTCAYFLNTTQISPTATAQFYVNDYIYNGQDTGISQSWINQFNLSNVAPAALTVGGSGLTYLQAYLWGYDPTKYSTNLDGLSDLENHILGYAATNFDINNYGLSNAQQLALGLNPFSTGINPPPPPPAPTNNSTTLTITKFTPQGATLVP